MASLDTVTDHVGNVSRPTICEPYLKGEKMASPGMVTVHVGNISRPMAHVDNAKLMIRLTLVVSLVMGPAVFLLCRWMNSYFASGEKLLALFALSVMGFESVWVIYGLGVLINKAVHNGMDNSRFE